MNWTVECLLDTKCDDNTPTNCYCVSFIYYDTKTQKCERPKFYFVVALYKLKNVLALDKSGSDILSKKLNYTKLGE